MQRTAFADQVRVGSDVLDLWIEDGWLKPCGDRTAPVFTEIDVARARLIAELRDALGMNEEAIPVVLDLIDQIHGLRRLVRGLLEQSRPVDSRPNHE